MRNVSDQEKQLSNHIYLRRSSGDLEGAIQICNEAIERYNRSNFFFKIKGDILYELGKYEDAVSAYMSFLDRIKSEPEFFTKFTSFLAKVAKKTEISHDIFEKLAEIIGKEDYPYVVKRGLLTILLEIYPLSEKLWKKIEACRINYTIQCIKEGYEWALKAGKCETIVFLCNIEKDSYSKRERSVNQFVLKRLELEQLYEPAVKLVKKMLEYSTDLVDVRSLFRICRKREDYTEAKELMCQRDIVQEKEFNVQYELVLFFEEEGDEEARNQALAYIAELSAHSIPICQTLFKFYIKYDMLEQAKRIQERIVSYSEKSHAKGRDKKIDQKRVSRANKETQDVIWEKLQTLVGEQEHSRQLLAMAELIKGFSHELGQPITNIRYAIQYFNRKNRKLQRKVNSEEKNLLEGILVQTERVGKLLDRFAPLTSSRSQKEYFSVLEIIHEVFDELSLRLSNEDIVYRIIGDAEEEIYGEALQFSQVFYNLIINSIHSIHKKGVKGELLVEQYIKDEVLVILFSDNGVGIAPELQRKIFEPFFSTKRKEVEEGGEGLGLFIVWNILKMFQSRIYVNPSYKDGAQFVIEINREGKKDVSDITCRG